LRPVGELEPESRPEQSARYDASALQDQLALRAHESRAKMNHPPRSGETDRHAPGLAQRAHEIGVRQGPRGGQVDGPGHLFLLDEPGDGADEIDVLNPGDILSAVAGPAAEAEAHQAEQRIEDPAAI